MALHGNVFQYHRNAMRFGGGATLALERSNFNKGNAERNSFVGGIPPQGGTPNGVSWPYAWVNAVKNGALASYTAIVGTGDVNASGISARLSEATLSGSGDASADLAVLMKAIAALSGSGDVSSATIAAVSKLIAALAGNGSATASMSAIVPMIAELLGSAGMGSNLTGKNRLEATIQPEVATTYAGIAAAVWDESAASHNTVGTMGYKLNNAGGGGSDPSVIAAAVWDEMQSAHLDAGSIGLVLSKITEKLTELHQIAGLDASAPMTVTPTSREAGGITQTISGDGIASSTVTRT